MTGPTQFVECRKMRFMRRERVAFGRGVMLGGKPGWQNIPNRPKGMHARTYERFIGKILISDKTTHDAAIRILQRFQAKLHISEKPEI